MPPLQTTVPTGSPLTLDGRPLLGLPEQPALAAALTAGFLGVFYLVYGAANSLSALVPWSVGVTLPIDGVLPFVARPWAAVYLSMDALLLLCPLALRTRAELLPLFGVLVAQTLLAGVCFVLLPVEAGLEAPEGWHGPAFAVADALNLDRNYLPSLHVTFSYTAALAIGRRCRWPAWLGLLGWASAIALSTLLLRQHFALDVVAGVALAVLGARELPRLAARMVP